MQVKNKKISILAAARHIVQLVAFLLLPGLFITTFSAVKDVYVAIIGGSFHLTALLPQLFLLAGVFLVTAIMGRFFCGFLCSFGAMGDLLWFISRKLKLPHPKVGEGTDRLLKLLKYVLLLFLVVFVWTLGLVAIDSTFDPWTIFGMYASVKGWPAGNYLLSVGGLLLLLIMIGSFVVERFFCRYLCPLGAIFTVISRFRLFRIKKPSEQCGACRACTKHCSMGIPLYQSDVVTSGECIDCFACVDACPRQNVTANPTPAVAAAIAVTTMTGLYYVGNLVGSTASAASDTSTSESTTSDSAAASDVDQGPYTDGVYTGSASGYRGMTTVQVTVENGYITDVEVASTGDDMEFFNKAKATVIADILETQDTDVDAVSGATFSSNAIMNAVANALSEMEKSNSTVFDAQTSTESSDSTASDTQVSTNSTTSTAQSTDTGSASTGSSTSSSASTSTSAGTSQAASTSTQTESTGTTAAASASDTSTSTTKGSVDLTDGVYTGSGSGFRGTTTVSVTVSDGTITDITVESYQDDREYFVRAQSSVIASILEEQDVDVDAVSGATFSSNGIMEAVADALGIDYVNPNSTLGGQHGGPRP